MCNWNRLALKCVSGRSYSCATERPSVTCHLCHFNCHRICDQSFDLVGHHNKEMKNSGGGGLVAKSGLTHVIAWTVACQAPLPWDSPGKNTGVGFSFLLQGIFPTQGLKLGLLHCRQILYH